MLLSFERFQEEIGSLPRAPYLVSGQPKINTLFKEQQSNLLQISWVVSQ